MRERVLAFLLAGFALPALAARQVTVAEVEQLLTQAHGEKDGSLAKELSGVELTERVSPQRLERWEEALPGPKARQALLILADSSAFLELPGADIQAGDAPGREAQRQMMTLTVEYLAKAIPRLPNFMATRETSRFVEMPEGGLGSYSSSSEPLPLRLLDRLKSTVLYRDGQEVVDSGKGKQMKPGQVGDGLITIGVFGPILSTVIVDAAHGNIAWSHWENGTGARRAVYNYRVPLGQSHFEVSWCCKVLKPDGNGVQLEESNKLSAYHGEIAIDPDSGAILRLTLKADMEASDPISQSSIAVDYGPVEIGGVTYICPLRSISLGLAPIQIELHPHTGAAAGPKRRSMNDVQFSEYHLFRAETRILTDDAAQTQGNAPASAPPPHP